jgi:hypothetical protein
MSLEDLKKNALIITLAFVSSRRKKMDLNFSTLRKHVNAQHVKTKIVLTDT